MKITRGFVLISTLLLLLIVTLIAMNLLQQSYFEMQMSQGYHTGQQNFYQAQSLLMQIEKQISQGQLNSRCLNEFCYLTNEASYSVELLHGDPCVVISQTFWQANFYRIDLVFQKKNSVIKLQSVFATPSATVTQCPIFWPVNESRQSWRELV